MKKPKKWLTTLIVILTFVSGIIPLVGLLTGILLIIKIKSDNKIFYLIDHPEVILGNLKDQVEEQQNKLKSLDVELKEKIEKNNETFQKEKTQNQQELKTINKVLEDSKVKKIKELEDLDFKIKTKLKAEDQELEDAKNKKQQELDKLNLEIRDKVKSDNEVMYDYNQRIDKLKSEESNLKDKIHHIKNEYQNYDNVSKQIKSYKDLEKILTTLQVGLYEKNYDFDISEEYKNALKNKQKEESEYVRRDKAIDINLINNILNTYSLKKSDYNKVMNAIIKLSLRAFNNECDSAISKITSKNIINIRKRVESSFDHINKIIDCFGLSLSIDYLKLKINEVQLSYEYEVKRSEEREEQKQLKDQMREEAKVKSEIDKLEKQAQKETEMYEKALKKVALELENASSEEKNKLSLEIEGLKDKLKEAEEKMQRAKSMAEQTKTGFVYVISNVGSFGENIYKIGMTRRLDPTERISELSSASVPFPFDIHATIKTDDAPALENALHKKFENSKLNKVNSRKEFFKVSLDEIEQAVKELYGDFKLTKQAEAYEYKQSISEEENEIA